MTAVEPTKLSLDEKRELLAKHLLDRIANAHGPHPISHSQEARFRLAKRAPQSGVENHSFAWRIRAPVETQGIEAALGLLMRYYSALRSEFSDYQQQCVRFVPETYDVPFVAHDASTASDDEVHARMAGDAAVPFNLASGPLIRVQLFSRSRYDHTLQVTAHHIVVDFWSLGILVRELARSYVSIVRNETYVAAYPPMDYTRFVLWEASQAAGHAGERALEYWHRQFNGALDSVELPLDRAWPGTRGFQDTEYRFVIPASTVQELRALCSTQAHTQFTVLLAAYMLVIYSYTGQQTIPVVSPVSVRNLPEFEHQVGAYSNHMLVCGRISSGQTFADFLQQVGGAIVGGIEHAAFPFSLVSRRVTVRGLPEGAVRFPLKFNMPKAASLKGAIANSSSSGSALVVSTDAFDAELEFVDRRVTGSSELNLGVFQARNGLIASLQYNMEVFDRSTIAALAARFVHLAEIVVARPESTLRDIAIALR